MTWRSTQLYAWSWLRPRASSLFCALAAPLLLGAIFACKAELFLDYAIVRAATYVLALLSLGITASIGNSAEDNTSFPQRFFLLPRSSLFLIAVPLGMAALLSLVSLVLWIACVFSPLGFEIPVLWPSLLAVTVAFSYPAVLWTLERSATFRLLGTSIVGSFLLLWTISKVQLPQPSLQTYSIVLSTISLSSCLACYRAIVRRRKGESRSILEFLGKLRSDSRSRRKQVFKNSKQAQCWYEWRNWGRMLPALVFAVNLLFLAPIAWTWGDDPEIAVRIFGFGIAAPLLLSVVIGKGASRADFWSRRWTVPQHLSTLPQKPEELVSAKILTAAKSAGAAWLLTLLTIPAILAIFCNNENLSDTWDRAAHIFTLSPILIAMMVLALMVVLSWRFLIISLPIGLSGRRTWFLSIEIGSVVLLLAAFICVVVFARAESSEASHELRSFIIRHLSTLCWIVNGIFIAKLAVTWRTVLAAQRKAQLSERSTRAYAIVWISVTSMTLAAVFGVLHSHRIWREIDWIVAIAMLLALGSMPLARVALAVPAFVSNRHRSTDLGKRDGN